MSKTVCFTGHRPKSLCSYRKEAYTSFVRFLTEYCSKLYKEGYETFITGGAQGIDQLAFWAVDNMKNCPNKTNIVCLPFKNYGNNWSQNGLFSKSELSLICDRADIIRTGVVEPKDTREVINALMARNRAMIDDSDMLVAIYENKYSWQYDNGGTADAIRYAKSQNKDIAIFVYNADEIKKANGSCELDIEDIHHIYANTNNTTPVALSPCNTPTDEYLVVSGRVTDTEKEKDLAELACFINTNKKLVVEAEDHDGYTWYYGEPLENVINNLSDENAEYLYDLLKNKLGK